MIPLMLTHFEQTEVRKYEPTTRKRKLALPKNGRRRRELCCCTTVRWIIIIIMLSYPPAAWSPSRCSSKCKILCWRIMVICILLLLISMMQKEQVAFPWRRGQQLCCTTRYTHTYIRYNSNDGASSMP